MFQITLQKYVNPKDFGASSSYYQKDDADVCFHIKWRQATPAILENFNEDQATETQRIKGIFCCDAWEKVSGVHCNFYNPLLEVCNICFNEHYYCLQVVSLMSIQLE